MKISRNVNLIKNSLLILLLLSSAFNGCFCDNESLVQNVSTPASNSLLLISTDAGETWTINETSTGKVLRNLSYSYSNSGYRIIASGNSGAILSTTNLGSTFMTRNPFSELDFCGAGFSAPEGRIVLTNGDKSHAESSDGGETWVTKSTGTLYISYIDISPALTLFQAACSIGDPKNIYITTNGGSNWLIKSADATNEDDFGGISFLRGNIIIAYGSNGLMLRSTSYGENWNKVILPVTDRIFSAAVNPEWQTVITNTATRGKFLKSTDLGGTWELKDIPTANSYTPQVFAISYSGAVIGAGYKGSMVKSTDLGETWKEINTGTVADIDDVMFINNSLVAAIAH